MKYRSLNKRGLLLSEVGLAFDSSHSAIGREKIEMLARVAYDEGINHFLISDTGFDCCSGIGSIFSKEHRAKVHFSIKTRWTGQFETFQKLIDHQLAIIRTPMADLLSIQNVAAADLQSGSIGDAIHRLRVSGRISSAGVCASELAGHPDRRLLERNSLEFFENKDNQRFFSNEEKLLPYIVGVPSLSETSKLSFLWDQTGRTRVQTEVQLMLAQSGVSSVLVSPISLISLKEMARAPMTPSLMKEEIIEAKQAFSRSTEMAGV